VKVELDNEEAWLLMSNIVGRLIEETPLADADRARIRRWKSDEMRATSQEMRVLTEKINQDMEKLRERKTKNPIRRPDWSSGI
jgi:hypothetical protein